MFELLPYCLVNADSSMCAVCCRFAQLAAAVFLHAGIKVYLFPVVCPTPFVVFLIIIIELMFEQ